MLDPFVGRLPREPLDPPRDSSSNDALERFRRRPSKPPGRARRIGDEDGHVVVGRAGRAEPEEVAPAYVFLASPVTGSYITGLVLPVIGGVVGAMTSQKG